MAELTTAWMLGCVCGFFMGVTVARPPRDRDPDWRRSFNHENTNRPSGPPPLKLRRSGDPDAILPTTPKPNIVPKPQPPLGRIIDASGRTIGYRPLPWDGPTNPPPRNP